jgi:hypothetical protein
MTRAEAVAAVLATARGEVGVAEEPRGSNWGPRVAQYLAVTGWRKPAYWCAAFVAWVGREALGESWPLPLSASCDVLLDHARRHRVLFEHDPRPGDLFLVMASHDDATHVGFVTGVASDSVATVEGNSNSGGSRNGWEVAARPARPRTGRLRYVRWADLIEETEPGWTLLVGASLRLPLVVEDGASWVGVRALLEALHGSAADTLLGWEDGPTWRGAPIPVPVRVAGGVAYGRLRDLARWQGLGVLPNEGARTVALVRPTQG